MYSIVVPVYKNEQSLVRVVGVISDLQSKLDQPVEAVFVVDGSPDRSFEKLKELIEPLDFPVQLIAHARNFGSFAAIRTGLIAARGDYFGVMAADLQEPPDLMLAFFKSLSTDQCDVAIGTRSRRHDPLVSRWMSALFWRIYRRMVVHDMPAGGVDVFGCNLQFRNQLLLLQESRSSLIALIFWLGFRRKLIAYDRLERTEGQSAWTFKKKMDYLVDSVFSFTDYPIKILVRAGAVGSVFAIGLAVIVLAAKLSGAIAVPGYAATLLVVLIFGTLNLLGLGLVGVYAWRAYENSKQRPLAVVAVKLQNKHGDNHE
jgi:polyisoprenyl-phosphate glycosyltransferase